MEVAAEFHQEEVLVWLLRDATVFERELVGVFALERKLAKSLVVALENGLHPWWNRTREVSLKWRASSDMEFVSAPEGFSSDCGWWTTLSGATSALRGLGSEIRLGPARPNEKLGVRSTGELKWTEAMSQAQMADAKLARLVVFPCGVTAIGEWALHNFAALELVVFPASCIDFGMSAFEGCKALRAISLPAGCKATGEWAIAGCSSLVSVAIPAGCTTISSGCFSGSTSLTGVRFPNGLRLIGEWAFYGSALKEIALPDGCEVAKCAFGRCKALTKVMIGSDCCSIGESAFRDCIALVSVTIGVGCLSIGQGVFAHCGALTTVTIEDGLKSIDWYAFVNCTRLASVTLPSSVQSVGFCGFGNCKSLATVAIPKGCRLDTGHDAFWGCSPQVTRF
jgi:hypothetical protein